MAQGTHAEVALDAHVAEALQWAETLRIAARQQQAVATLGVRALGTPSLQELFEQAVLEVAEALGAARAAVHEWDRHTGRLHVRAAVGAQMATDLQASAQRCLDGRAPDVAGEGTLSVPIQDARHVFGVLSAMPGVGGQFELRDVHFLQSVANVVAAFIQRSREQACARQRERWLQAYFDLSPDVVLRLDADGVILGANPAAERLLGSPAAELRGQPSRRLGLSDTLLGTWCIAVAQVHRCLQDQTLELPLTTPHGQGWYEARLTAVLDDQDGPVEFVGAILRDCTDRWRAEQQVKELQRQALEREDRLQALLTTLVGERSVLRERARAWGLAALSAREQMILRLLAQGRTNREIAEQLGLSPGTVKNRVSLLLPKLGAADRTQAVVLALQLGLLDTPVPDTAAQRAATDSAHVELRPARYYYLGDFE